MLTADDQLALKDRLSKTIYHHDYKRLFAGIEFGALIEGALHVYVQNEYCAGQIEALYSPHIISAAKIVTDLRVIRVNVLPKDFSYGTVFVLADRRESQRR